MDILYMLNHALNWLLSFKYFQSVIQILLCKSIDLYYDYIYMRYAFLIIYMKHIYVALIAIKFYR